MNGKNMKIKKGEQKIFTQWRYNEDSIKVRYHHIVCKVDGYMRWLQYNGACINIYLVDSVSKDCRREDTWRPLWGRMVPGAGTDASFLSVHCFPTKSPGGRPTETGAEAEP